MDISAVFQDTALKHADLVAGRAGLGNQVVWVHIVDHPDIADWIKPGHLLLMTGYHWPKDEAEQRALIFKLDERRLSGIILAVPRFLAHFPDSVRKAADQVGLPLFEIPWEVPFTQLTEEIHRRVIAHQHELLVRSDEIHRALTMVAATSDNLGSLAGLLADKLGRDTSFVSNNGVLLGATSGKEERRQFEAAYLRTWSERAGSIIQPGGEAFQVPAFRHPASPARLGCAVRVHGEQRALVWMDGHDIPFTDLDRRAIEHAAVIAALHLAHAYAIRHREEQLGYALLESLLDGSFLANESSLERARIAGWDSCNSYRVGLIQIKADMPASRNSLQRLDRCKTLLQGALAGCSAPKLLFSNASQLYFLLPVSVKADSFWRDLRLGAETAFAVSRSFQGVEGVARGKQDVQDLVPYLSWGHVVTFDQILLPRALSGDAQARRLFIERRIGRILAQQKSEALVDTLAALGSTGFQLTRAATQLGIHINTLRYRVGHIQDLVDGSLDDGGFRFELQLALTLWRQDQDGQPD
jgi:purine catabolism regulator